VYPVFAMGRSQALRKLSKGGKNHMAKIYSPFNGGKIKQHILVMHLTQAEFARNVGYGERTVRKWIQKGVYDYRLLGLIADTLGCDVLDLILE
jgi:hypothetical protein